MVIMVTVHQHPLKLCLLLATSLSLIIKTRIFICIAGHTGMPLTNPDLSKAAMAHAVAQHGAHADRPGVARPTVDMLTVRTANTMWRILE